MHERPLDTDDAAELAALAALTRRCLAADGGLPLAAEDWFVRRRFLSGTGIAIVGGGGGLLAGRRARFAGPGTATGT